MSGEHKFHPTEIRLPNFEIAWAGETLDTDALCFGSTDGRLWFTKIKEPIKGMGPMVIAESGEPITGVAFWSYFMAASTPNEIVIHYNNAETNEKRKTMLEVGAHGILATPSGRFLAPIGVGGLLEIKPIVNVNAFPNLHTVRGKALNFYSAVFLSGNQTEVIACATRRDGITVARLPQVGDGGKVRLIPCEGVDVVDVCTLGYQDLPLAVAAIGIDGSLFLMKNVLEDGGPLALRFVGMQGTAYRILSADGNVFVLTSDFLYVLPSLVQRCLREGNAEGPISVTIVPLRAVDCFMAYGRWLLVIMPGFVASIDIHTFLGGEKKSLFEDLKDFVLRDLYNKLRRRAEPTGRIRRELTPTATWPKPSIEDSPITSDQMTVSTWVG